MSLFFYPAPKRGPLERMGRDAVVKGEGGSLSRLGSACTALHPKLTAACFTHSLYLCHHRSRSRSAFTVSPSLFSQLCPPLASRTRERHSSSTDYRGRAGGGWPVFNASGCPPPVCVSFVVFRRWWDLVGPGLASRPAPFRFVDLPKPGAERWCVGTKVLLATHFPVY